MRNELVNLDDLPLNRFHIKITALTFGAILSIAWVPGTKDVNLNEISDIQLGGNFRKNNIESQL